MLRPIRQIQALNLSFTTPWTQERGGILSHGSASGIAIVEYAANPSGAVPLGVQYNDVEWINQSYEPSPYRIREVEVPCGVVGAITQGEFETDWVHIVGSVFTGDSVYMGPSGTFTNSASFGGLKIGRFTGEFKPDPHLLTYRGLGFTRSYMQNGVVVIENDPNDRVLVLSDGYAQIRIDQRTIMKAQRS